LSLCRSSSLLQEALYNPTSYYTLSGAMPTFLLFISVRLFE
jgi:hypothetical protein